MRYGVPTLSHRALIAYGSGDALAVAVVFFSPFFSFCSGLAARSILDAAKGRMRKGSNQKAHGVDEEGGVEVYREGHQDASGNPFRKQGVLRPWPSAN